MACVRKEKQAVFLKDNTKLKLLIDEKDLVIKKLIELILKNIFKEKITSIKNIGLKTIVILLRIISLSSIQISFLIAQCKFAIRQLKVCQIKFIIYNHASLPNTYYELIELWMSS